MTLLKETIETLATHGKVPADVLWVGGGEPGWGAKGTFVGSWEDFERFANFEYDAGFGGAEINTTLKVVGADWWLERGEYDGSEWWEFKTLPKRSETAAPMRESDIKDR